MSRLNQFVASLSGISRRSADRLIASGKILVNGETAEFGYRLKGNDRVTSTDSGFKFDHFGSDKPQKIVLTLNKPAGYVCSRSGQGSKTIYELLPQQYHHLKPVGRLDKDSSGLLLLTNDGKLADELTHPKHQKEKVYRVKLDKPLVQKDRNKLLRGVELEDGLSKFISVKHYSDDSLDVTLTEGRNRQIRRTFETLGYEVRNLERTKLGKYELRELILGAWQIT